MPMLELAGQSDKSINELEVNLGMKIKLESNREKHSVLTSGFDVCVWCVCVCVYTWIQACTHVCTHIHKPVQTERWSSDWDDVLCSLKLPQLLLLYYVFKVLLILCVNMLMCMWRSKDNT